MANIELLNKYRGDLDVVKIQVFRGGANSVSGEIETLGHEFSHLSSRVRYAPNPDVAVSRADFAGYRLSEKYRRQVSLPRGIPPN